MSLVALDGTPLMMLGGGQRPLGGGLAANTSLATLAAAKAAAIMIGRVFTEDGASHTIDTTGSSSMGWRSGALTFANAATTVVVGLATVDAANGAPGRATNSTGTITPSVSKSHTGGGGGITANAWQENVPSSGSLAIANGDLLAAFVQMTARGGADSVVVQAQAMTTSLLRPNCTSFDGTSTYTNATQTPNFTITFSDGKLGWFYGGAVINSTTAQTWNSGSATKEYGNYLLMPFPAKIYGLYGAINLTTNAADCDGVLYSDPLGTPVAEKTITLDANTVHASAAQAPFIELFTSPYSAKANQPLAAIFKPGATDVTSTYRIMNASAHQKSLDYGSNGYAVNRASGAFAAQNSNKDRFSIGLLVGAFSQENNQLINSGSLVQ